MNYKIKFPGTGMKAVVRLPSSKSICNRALILNALSGSPCPVQNLSDCDDTAVLAKALNSETRDVDIRAAGTAMRFLTAFLARAEGEWTLTGTERMKDRPIRILVDALNAVGARVEYMGKEGFPPLRIRGSALQGGEISLPGGVSSQYASALLMIAPLMEKGLVLHLEGDMVSKPYVRLTLQLMERFGIRSEWEGPTIRVSPQSYRPVPFTVESDWSAASYWYEMAALSPRAEIRLEGLSGQSLQGDAACAGLFARLGVGTSFVPDGVVLKKTGKEVRKLIYDFVDEPDLAQTFVVACAGMNVPFRFSGLQSLKIKETDRIEALKQELRKAGYVLKESSNSILEWDGRRCEAEENLRIATHEDHRMAMAFAPLALIRPAGIEIEHPEVVSKSYPHYWEHLAGAGFQIEERTK